MAFSLWHFFCDPVLRAPTLGSMLVGFTSALIGVVVFVKRRSLIGETLAHAAYPGLILGILLIPALKIGEGMGLFIGASITALLGLLAVEGLERRCGVHPDTALCLVLAIFLGIGVVMASRMQFIYPVGYQKARLFLYGQAATMNDKHLFLYGGLALLISSLLVLDFRRLELIAFDRTFARSMGIGTKAVDGAIYLLMILALVMGIRSVGVVLISGMFIAPAVTAHQWTHRFSMLFILSSCLGVVSGFFGNYFSLQIPFWMGGRSSFSLPTGPMILLFNSCLALFSLLFAPDRGACSRYLRACRFRFHCILENILKTLWKGERGKCLGKSDILRWHSISPCTLGFMIFLLKKRGWVLETADGYLLTARGEDRAAHLVRLHRLWELYLVSCLKMDGDEVHRGAEEIEHILTPELERALAEILQDPQRDPHKQPIPKVERR